MSWVLPSRETWEAWLRCAGLAAEASGGGSYYEAMLDLIASLQADLARAEDRANAQPQRRDVLQKAIGWVQAQVESPLCIDPATGMVLVKELRELFGDAPIAQPESETSCETCKWEDGSPEEAPCCYCSHNEDRTNRWTPKQPPSGGQQEGDRDEAEPVDARPDAGAADVTSGASEEPEAGVPEHACGTCKWWTHLSSGLGNCAAHKRETARGFSCDRFQPVLVPDTADCTSCDPHQREVCGDAELPCPMDGKRPSQAGVADEDGSDSFGDPFGEERETTCVSDTQEKCLPASVQDWRTVQTWLMVHEASQRDPQITAEVRAAANRITDYLPILDRERDALRKRVAELESDRDLDPDVILERPERETKRMVVKAKYVKKGAAELESEDRIAHLEAELAAGNRLHAQLSDKHAETCGHLEAAQRKVEELERERAGLFVLPTDESLKGRSTFVSVLRRMADRLKDEPHFGIAVVIAGRLADAIERGTEGGEGVWVTPAQIRRAGDHLAADVDWLTCDCDRCQRLRRALSWLGIPMDRLVRAAGKREQRVQDQATAP